MDSEVWKKQAEKSTLLFTSAPQFISRAFRPGTPSRQAVFIAHNDQAKFLKEMNLCQGFTAQFGVMTVDNPVQHLGTSFGGWKIWAAHRGLIPLRSNSSATLFLLFVLFHKSNFRSRMSNEEVSTQLRSVQEDLYYPLEKEKASKAWQLAIYFFSSLKQFLVFMVEVERFFSAQLFIIVGFLQHHKKGIYTWQELMLLKKWEELVEGRRWAGRAASQPSVRIICYNISTSEIHKNKSH